MDKLFFKPVNMAAFAVMIIAILCAYREKYDTAAAFLGIGMVVYFILGVFNIE